MRVPAARRDGSSVKQPRAPAGGDLATGRLKLRPLSCLCNAAMLHAASPALHSAMSETNGLLVSAESSSPIGLRAPGPDCRWFVKPEVFGRPQAVLDLLNTGSAIDAGGNCRFPCG